MARIEGEIVIRRSIEDVFDFVVDERNEPRYNPRMLRAEKLSPGPIGLGTRFRAEFSSFLRPVAMSEITGHERPRRLASRTHMSAMEVQGTLTFDAVPEGTRMRWSWDLEPRGVFKLITPIVTRIGRRQEEATWASLKRFLEAGRLIASRRRLTRRPEDRPSPRAGLRSRAPVNAGQTDRSSRL
jgi:Polyketide cyclase / dehydrase and lipid transport